MTAPVIVGIVACVCCLISFGIGYGVGTVANKKRLERFEKTAKEVYQARDDMKVIKKVVEKMLEELDEKSKRKT